MMLSILRSVLMKCVPYHSRQFWNKWGETFINEKYQRGIYPQHHWLLEKIQKVRPQTILEVGCGFGRNIKFLLENLDYSIAHVTGVDISESMLRHAVSYISKRYISMCQLQVMNLPNLSFMEEQFDVIFTHGVLMHIAPSSLRKSLCELCRVTRNGGHIFLIEEVIGEQRMGCRAYVRLNRYTWAHNYANILTSLDCVVVVEHHMNQGNLDWIWLKKIYRRKFRNCLK